MSVKQREEYAAICGQISMLESSYFEETQGVQSHLLPVSRVIIQYKELEVQRDQRLFSLSCTRVEPGSAKEEWPEVHTSQNLAKALAQGMAPSFGGRGVGVGSRRQQVRLGVEEKEEVEEVVVGRGKGGEGKKSGGGSASGGGRRDSSKGPAAEQSKGDSQQKGGSKKKARR